MKKKPIVFIVLGLLHLIEPLFKVLYFKVSTQFDWTVIATNLLGLSNPIDIFHFWFLFPLAGIALLTVKSWSHPLFIGVQAYSIYIHLTYEKFSWPYVAEAPFLSSLVLLTLNTLLIVYFLSPHVRKPFFNKDIRWWEHHRRYAHPFPCTFSIENPNKLEDAYVLNISLSGAFINYTGSLNDGQIINLNLSFNNTHFSIKAKKVSSHAFGGSMGMGVRFIYSNFYEKFKMRRLIKSIARANKVQEKIVVAA